MTKATKKHTPTGATIHVLPEPLLRPELERLYEILNEADGDPCTLYAIAETALQSTQVNQGREGPVTREREIGIVNGLTLAFLALAGILNVPRAVAVAEIGGRQ